MVGGASTEGGTSDDEGVLLAGIVLEGLGSLADSAASGAAELDSATLAVSDVAGSAVLAASGAEAAASLDEAVIHQGLESRKGIKKYVHLHCMHLKMREILAR